MKPKPLKILSLAAGSVAVLAASTAIFFIPKHTPEKTGGPHTPDVAVSNQPLDTMDGPLSPDGDAGSAREKTALPWRAAHAPKPALVAETGAIAREHASLEVRLEAIYKLSHWANDPDLWEAIAGELIETIDTLDDPAVRGHAIQTLALRGDAATDSVTAALIEYLEFDPSPKNRAIAALGLGSAPDDLRPVALHHLERAFETETDLEVRRNILTHLARAGGPDAMPVLLRLRAEHPLLQQDILDFVEILHDGISHPDEIYPRKFVLDAERDTIVGSPSLH